MFVADVIFSYTTTAGTFYNGDAGDLLLTIGLFLMTFGILGFASKPAVKARKGVV
jgi:F0F1-type ATP synthase assembly protein I